MMSLMARLTVTTIYCTTCRGLTPVVDCREDDRGYLYCAKCWKKRG